MSDVAAPNSRFPKPIAEMGAWDFWADAYSIGLSAEDAEAIHSGRALPDQIDRAQFFGLAAKEALLLADCGSPQHRKPS
jgi:hypothetical protein